MNYDIYDKELTAMDRGLETWRHILLGRPTIIHTDHRNLTYYWQSQQLSQRARQAVAQIMQYDISIKHKLGILNKADALSQWPDHPQDNDNKTEVAFPSSMFINETTTTNILLVIITEQANNPNYFINLTKTFSLEYKNNIWFNKQQIIVLENNNLR